MKKTTRAVVLLLAVTGACATVLVVSPHVRLYTVIQSVGTIGKAREIVSVPILAAAGNWSVSPPSNESCFCLVCDRFQDALGPNQASQITLILSVSPYAEETYCQFDVSISAADGSTTCATLSCLHLGIAKNSVIQAVMHRCCLFT